MGNQHLNCVGSGNEICASDVLIVNLTGFALVEPEASELQPPTDCKKKLCNHDHHRGMEMKHGFTLWSCYPRGAPRQIDAHQQVKIRISGRQGSQHGPEGTIRYDVIDASRDKVGEVLFYFSRVPRSTARHCQATVSGERCHPHLRISSKFEAGSRICTFTLAAPSPNIDLLHATVDSTFGGGLVGHGECHANARATIPKNLVKAIVNISDKGINLNHECNHGVENPVRAGIGFVSSLFGGGGTTDAAASS